MRFAGDVVEWFAAAEHWRGHAGVPNRLWEHLQISGIALLAAAAIALPLGLVLGHTGRGGLLAVNVSNIGRAIPSFAILVLVVQWTGVGTAPAIAALVALAAPPILTNTYVAIRAVDPDVREAAHGMGMTGMQRLARVEAPLAMPLIMAGVRTSAVQVVATATLAAVIGEGGLGRLIVDGQAVRDEVRVVAGAFVVALLSVLTELGLGLVQRHLGKGHP